MSRAFCLWPAYWRPEIDLVTIDLDQIKELEQEKSAIHLLLVLHELLHKLGSGRTWQEQNGLVLNISNFAFESVRNIFARKDKNLTKVKEDIIKTEIACDNLFLSSHNLVESLNAYQTKVGLDEVLKGHLIERCLDKQLEEMFGADFGKRVERIKYFALKELARLISRDKLLARQVVPRGIVKEKLKESEVLIKRLLRKSFTEDKTKIIHDIKAYLDSDIRSLASSILSGEKERLDMYSKLVKLKQMTDSFMFSNYVCTTALDIPFCPNPGELLFSVPLRYNPRRRFYLLNSKLNLLNGKKPLRGLSVVRKLAEEERRDEISSATVQEISRFLTEKTCLKIYDHFSSETPKGIPFCKSFIPFRSWIKKARKGKIKETLFMAGFREVEELKAKSPEKEVAGLVKLGFFPFLMVISGRRSRILFSPEHQQDNAWKSWWCLNHLKDQMICNTDIYNPLDLGYFDAPNHLYKEIEEAVKLAKRFESIRVSDWLWERFVQTSKSVGRPLIKDVELLP